MLQPQRLVVGSSQLSKIPGPLSPLQAGRKLLHSHPYAQEDIQNRLQDLNHKWEELDHRVAERGDRLQQTRQQGQLLELLQVPGECGMGVRMQKEDQDLAGSGCEQAGQKGLTGWPHEVLYRALAQSQLSLALPGSRLSQE